MADADSMRGGTVDVVDVVYIVVVDLEEVCKWNTKEEEHICQGRYPHVVFVEGSALLLDDFGSNSFFCPVMLTGILHQLIQTHLHMMMVSYR